MRTILFPDGHLPDPILVNTRDGDYTLYILSALLIVFFWCIILWHYSSSNVIAYGECNPGQCPTNINTGQKRCPLSNNASLTYNLENEVCNPPTSCTAFETPYAINSDGSFNVQGVCENNEICRCSANVTCPYFAEVKFVRQSSSGRLYAPDFYFVQELNNSPLTGQGGVSPVINNVLGESCFINISDAARLNASLCTSIETSDDIELCVKSNPCNSGRLTFVPSKTTNNFDPSIEGFTTPLACISADECDDKTIPVFSWSTGKVICHSI